MKKKVIVSVILAACFSFSGIFSGCDIFDKPTEPPVQTVYTLSTEDIALLLGAEYRPDFVLKQNGETIDATITFSSSATEYVSVLNGKLKAEKLGEATITAIATLENKEVARTTFKCKVNENKGIHPVKNSYLLYIYLYMLKIIIK